MWCDWAVIRLMKITVIKLKWSSVSENQSAQDNGNICSAVLVESAQHIFTEVVSMLKENRFSDKSWEGGSALTVSKLGWGQLPLLPPRFLRPCSLLYYLSRQWSNDSQTTVLGTPVCKAHWTTGGNWQQQQNLPIVTYIAVQCWRDTDACLEKSLLVWQRRILIEVADQCYVNGVFRTFV